MEVKRQDNKVCLTLTEDGETIILDEQTALILADRICGVVQKIRRKYGKRN